MWICSLSQEVPLEKEMAIHYSILAQEILWTEEPGKLQSVGSQRVRHNFATAVAASYIYCFIGVLCISTH